jgi:segregation and condensation protein B
MGGRCAASVNIQDGAFDGMSLKAKLEAVIYAAEEPVTLAQLAGLFADEALEWKAEQEAAAAEQAAKLAAQPAIEAAALPQLDEAFPYLELEPGTANESAEVADVGDIEPVEQQVPAGAEAGESGAERDAPAIVAAGEGAVEGAEANSETGGATEQDEANAESEAKRAARARDREVRVAIKQLLDDLVAEYTADGRGVEIREIAGGYRMATKPECHDAVRLFVKSLKPPMKLSLPALETLAVIAYKQPVTAPEVNEIRGVDSSGVFGSLLARKLIVTAGRKSVIGRPILYKTTREFLLRFGLKDVSELPSMEEFEKMAASELDDAEMTAEETTTEAAAEFNADLSMEEAGASDDAQTEAERNPEENAPNGAE